MSLESILQRLSDRVAALRFAPPVTHVYNPLEYAWPAQREYLRRFGEGRGRIVLLGMNPGPFGMAQTGVPFGDVGLVRDWMGIDVPVGKPGREHPRRPVQGFDCPRGEVSGRRLWGWARERHTQPEAFFRGYFVLNYCPLVFMEDSGRNRTPDKLPRDEREPLYRACDQALHEAMRCLEPAVMVGIGRFARDCLARVCSDLDVPIVQAPHPSPASPIANRGWAPLMDAVDAECRALIAGRRNSLATEGSE